MPQHEIFARDLTSGQPTRLIWREDKILAIEAAADAPNDTWIAASLIDLQINGFAGVDFQQDNLSLKELLHAVEKLRATGCTRFLLTLITDRWPAMLARLQHLRTLRSQHDQLRRAIVGWHIEGPFLSAEPGFCGAHDPALMLDPKPEYMG
ncbi:MAG TPA: N-acetylglucosamine-6-phosphate deacetylase, partial [Verrucomicrobiae bacterium]|nr:N-acetylglucosamine-6-phosphate deacetylase [Verrucomicrobiae bacterium]